MKKIFISLLALSIIIFTACNSGDKSAKPDDMSKMNPDSTKNTTQPDSDIATVTPTFANLDTKLSADMKSVVGHYLHVKNALTNDNADEAANGSKAISEALGKIDKSLFTAEQKKVYDENEADLKEHAEQISKSKIDSQREHFAMMSEDMYALVKAFGGGQALYHDHCPMFNDNKGAMWLSETKEIKNPYMGSSMPKCGKVEEMIK